MVSTQENVIVSVLIWHSVDYSFAHDLDGNWSISNKSRNTSMLVSIARGEGKKRTPFLRTVDRARGSPTKIQPM